MGGVHGVLAKGTGGDIIVIGALGHPDGRGRSEAAGTIRSEWSGNRVWPDARFGGCLVIVLGVY